MAKRGRLSIEEREYILKNAGTKTAKEMAVALDRSEEGVDEFIKSEIGLKSDASKKDMVARREFRESAEWLELKKQFSEEELLYFEEQYAQWMAQLKENFVQSEETQAILLIKTQILLNRNLAEKQRAQQEIERMERMLDGLYAPYTDVTQMPERDKDRAIQIEEQLSTARAAQQAKTNEFVKLQEKHADLMKNLKATRDQRLKQIENVKVSFIDIIKDLMREENRLREGENMELVRMSAEKERIRLGQYHEFADGQVDRPLLTPETVVMENEE